jgi:hypothetical protein
MTRRWVVECIWSGYRSSQSRPCHRRVLREWEAKELAKITGIGFTDNTSMSVDVRPCKPREKVQEIRGYDDLFAEIRRLGMTGYVSIDGIEKRKREMAAERNAMAPKPAEADTGAPHGA